MGTQDRKVSNKMKVEGLGDFGLIIWSMADENILVSGKVCDV